MTDMPERIWAWHFAERYQDRAIQGGWDISPDKDGAEYIRADFAKENADDAYRAGFEAAKELIACGLSLNAGRMVRMSDDRKVSGVMRLVSEFVLDACKEIRAIDPPKREGETK